MEFIRRIDSLLFSLLFSYYFCIIWQMTLPIKAKWYRSIKIEEMRLWLWWREEAEKVNTFLEERSIFRLTFPRLVSSFLSLINREEIIFLQSQYYLCNWEIKICNHIYQFISYSPLGLDSKSFVIKLLNEKHCAIAPGIAFNTSDFNFGETSTGANATGNFKKLLTSWSF